MNTDNLISNITNGYIYGYSYCCIENFILRNLKETKSQSDMKLKGTGFICCKECDEKYSEVELINKINKNRLIQDKFKKNCKGINDDFYFEIKKSKEVELIKDKIINKMNKLNLMDNYKYFLHINKENM